MNAEQLYNAFGQVLRQRAGKSLIVDEMIKLLVVNGSAVTKVYLDNDGKVVTEAVEPREFFLTTGSAEPLAPTTDGRRYLPIWTDEVEDEPRNT